ncbi:hypothetical protein F9L16_04545 [Agarivorans sp. B2Z047]|uniref:hypothetical protein n=1 Tax=Agarivorans sp. B2Z047 TaxID=2652721 RepID=UPI00128D3094|nr:hypothetical protein [Agarivorans sp. B2Z047]MPW28268.1 hypothetical protein [Agarivorans sp. B2Z047]UQN43904.1 hypothetical protein LQZ07_05395 [Agarivorans sp. B2Z047]
MNKNLKLFLMIFAGVALATTMAIMVGISVVNQENMNSLAELLSTTQKLVWASLVVQGALVATLYFMWESWIVSGGSNDPHKIYLRLIRFPVCLSGLVYIGVMAL